MSLEVTSLYRTLLRSIPHAVRFSRPATKNVRRVLRDDFEAAVKSSSTEEQVLLQAKSTLLLHLASARSKSSPSKDHLLAHRAVGNISSLAYHHLSPNTRMQPLSKTRRVGGTFSSTQRRRRSQPTKIIQESALDSFEADGIVGAPPVEAQVLLPLVVQAKPPRGPILPTIARRYAKGRWDGQRPVTSVGDAPAYIAHLETTIEELGKEIRSLKDQYGPDCKQAKPLLEKIRREKGDLKTALRRRDEKTARANVLAEASSLLHNVTKQAEINTGAWLGGNRMARWAEGKWLYP